MEARCCWWIVRAGYVQEELQKCAPEILTGRKRKTREGPLRVSHRRHHSPSRDVKRNKSKSNTEDRLQPPQAPPPLIGSEVTLTVLDGIIDLGSVSLCELIAMASACYPLTKARRCGSRHGALACRGWTVAALVDQSLNPRNAHSLNITSQAYESVRTPSHHHCFDTKGKTEQTNKTVPN